jgi:hypothetical protein
MTTLIVRRLIESLVVLFPVSIMVFFVMRSLPGDPGLVSSADKDPFACNWRFPLPLAGSPCVMGRIKEVIMDFKKG